MHHNLGKDGSGGKHYNWVIPNYFDENEWEFSPKVSEDRPIVFMGRIIPAKGIAIMQTIIKALPQRKFKFAGQGNFDQYFSEYNNVEFYGALEGKERSKFLQGASAMLLPTLFIEPFGGAIVEAQFVGKI